MTKVYVIDNGGQWTHREWRVLRYLGVDTTIMPNTTPISALDVDGLVLSGGSPRVESTALGKTDKYLTALNVPLLAICVSHQFLAIHFGGKAGASEMPEFGKVELRVDNADELFEGLPAEFTVWESHNDEIQVLPSEFEALAHSDNCRYQAIRHLKRPLYGVQFHPEVEHTEHGYEIFENFLRLCHK